MTSTGLIGILLSFINNVYAVFFLSGLCFFGYKTFYLNKYSFCRENFNYKLAKLSPSLLAVCFGLGTVTYPVFDYFFLNYKLGFRYFYVLLFNSCICFSIN